MTEPDQQPETNNSSSEKEKIPKPTESQSEGVKAANQPPDDGKQPEASVAPYSEEALVTLQQEIASLRDQLELQSQQADALKAQYIRCVADFDNFRKRTEKTQEELQHRVKGETITELLPVIDNFERARVQIKPTTDGESSIHKSYQGVYRQLVDALKRIGVSAMRPEGEPFDPNFHEAVVREQTSEYPEGTVMEQLQRGYLLERRVLRHAMVKVAAMEEPVVSSEEESGIATDVDPLPQEN
ncbi:MAG: nucleotide exchange factor GrpE [Prochloron sp. SP5CPC1]|nr:nucleotide exchange factor GrpE [Candidatus Paraprochloron terpiosi SP5CPC1]